MDMIAELKKKQLVKEPLIYEGKDGAIEDIISGERMGMPLTLGDGRGRRGRSQPGAGEPPSPGVGTKPTRKTHTAKLPAALCPVLPSSSSSASSSSLLSLPRCLGLLCSALKTVPFTARTGKRSSRLFCDVSLNEESPL